jgi:phosphatidylglycerophosphate synthase
MVTVMGAICSWSAFLTAHMLREASDKNEWAEQHGMGWAYLGGTLIWLYNTLDNVDGKLARQRKMGSPLGQMMDHGCDALTVTLLASALGYGLGADFWWSMIVWSAGCAFWLCITWEEHYTHILRMEYVAADEAEYGAVLLVGYIGLMGGPSCVKDGIILPAIMKGEWALPLWHQLGMVPNTDDCKMIILILSVGMGLFSSVGSIFVVARKFGSLATSLQAIATDFIPFMLFVTLAFMWGTISNSKAEFNMYHRSLFMMTISTFFARMAISIIHASLVKQKIRRLFWEPLVPAIGVAVACGQLSLPAGMCLEGSLPWICLFGWVAFLQLLAALTKSYGDALGVTVLIHPDHPTMLDHGIANMLLTAYVGGFGAPLFLRPTVFLAGGLLPYFGEESSDPSVATLFYARAFGAALLALAATAYAHPTAPSVGWSFAAISLLLCPLVLLQVSAAGDASCTHCSCMQMWSAQAALHFAVTFNAIVHAFASQ